MNQNLRENLATATAAALAGLLALGIQYVLRPGPLPEPGEYFLTELARSQIGPESVGFALAAALALGFGLRRNPFLVGLPMVAAFPAIALYETTWFRGSHNLLPLEMAIVATWAVPLVVAAWLGAVARTKWTGPYSREQADVVEKHPTAPGG